VNGKNEECHMNIYLKPKTLLGKWSLGLLILAVLLFVVLIILVVSGQRGDDAFFSNLALTIPVLLAGVSLISALVTGLIAMIKSKERSILVILAVVIGIFALIFLLGEFLFPH
jgi:cytochrome bd-type quinol oxidase subunit 2